MRAGVSATLRTSISWFRGLQVEAKASAIRWQSSEYTSGDVTTEQLRLLPCVLRRNEGAHYSASTLSLPFSLVWTLGRGRTAGLGTTPNPYLAGLCNKRNIHYFWFPFTETKKKRRGRVVPPQVEFKKMGFSWSNCVWRQSQWSFVMSPGQPLPIGSSLNFSGKNESQMVSPENRF